MSSIPRAGLRKDLIPEFCLECFEHKMVGIKCSGCGWEFIQEEPKKRKIKSNLPMKHEINRALGYK